VKNPIEDVASKASGVARAATARLEGLSGVFNSLTEQHAEVLSLLRRLHGASSSRKQDALWREIRAELIAHERAETEVLYGELSRHEAAQDLMEAHATSKNQLDAAIHRVDVTDYGTDAWTTELGVLVELLEEHVGEEEQVAFPKAAELLGKLTAKSLDEVLSNRRKEILASL
jgi:hypothetical protein